MTTQQHLEVNRAYYNSYSEEKQSIAKPRHYLELYEKYFFNLFDKELHILELGIFDGHSLDYFSKTFPKAHISGVDINPCARTFSSDRIKTYQGSQDDPALFQTILRENNTPRFDIVIDDCSHIGSLTLASFNILLPLLAPGGLYIIEDWGTGYYKQWPGGRRFSAKTHLKTSYRIPKILTNLLSSLLWRLSLDKYISRMTYSCEYFASHTYGIPAILKQLVDEVAMEDASGPLGSGERISPTIEFVHIHPGIAFIQKRIA